MDIKKSVNNKVAVITGATSGIGRETALLFAQQGIKVVAAGRDEKSGLALVDEIKSSKGEAIFVKTDVSDSRSVQSLIHTAKTRFGEIDFAFNNAGIEGLLGPLASMEESSWDSVINTNLKGVWLCLKYQLPEIRRGGAVVNTSTNITKFGLAATGAYTASKAGVDALTQVAAIEYGKHGVRVNAISPGAVETPMLSRIYKSEEIEQLKRSNPLNSIPQPKDVAQTVLWLCSPLSNHVNGANIFIDGGASLLC